MMFKSTEKNKQNRDLMISYIVADIVLFYFSLGVSSYANSRGLQVFEVFSDMDFADVLNPISTFQWMTGSSFLSSLFVAVLAGFLMMAFYISGRRRKFDMKGIEQGEAQWTIDEAEERKQHGNKFKEPQGAKKYRETMMDKEYCNNIMFSNVYGLSMDSRKTRKNLHMLVIGGSGAGKTRFFVKPNILQMNSSYIITDPSGELYRDEAEMLEENNYDVRVFNIFDTNMSMQYNPLSYVRDDADVTNLVTTLIKNTGEAKGDNKYFDDATKLLLSAIILFLMYYCPKSEQDFAHVMRLVVAADVAESSKNPQSDLDKIFEQVENVDPHGLALKMYKSFKSTSGKSLKSVLSSTATRLTVFNYSEIERLTCADTLSLSTIGDEKVALFIITPPQDNGFNFLVAMMYTQLFSVLYYHTTFECRYLLTDNNYLARPFKSKEDADRAKDLIDRQKQNPDQELVRYEFDDMVMKYQMVDVENDNVLLRDLRQKTVEEFQNTPEMFSVKQNTSLEAGSPFHVRMLMDEFANISEIPNFSEVLATIRKYNVSVVIILQSLSQLKKLYEKDYESIIDNCDTFVFLGSKGQETTEYVSKMLGNRTITVRNASESTGKSKGTNFSYSQTKRELMTPHELVMLPTDEQVVIIKSVYPFKISKFKLEDHPNYKKSADGDGHKKILGEEFNLEKKIKEYNDRHNIDESYGRSDDEQAAINKRAQNTVDGWLNPDGKVAVGAASEEDSFFF